MSQNLVLRCTNIQKYFVLDPKSKVALHVLKGIDLKIEEGEIISIVGASGSGKSTFLHILGGLDRPSEGNVYWGEQDILRLSDEALAKFRGEHVGFIFQFHHLLPEFSALENVMLPILIRGGSNDSAEARACDLLTKVGLAERMQHRPSELAGGEQQRVAVARALANNPRIILADEPTGNLDSVTSHQLYELLFELNRTERQTFVIVTHNEKFAERSNRIFRMADGQLLGQ